MNDQTLRQRLVDAFDKAAGNPPDFEDVWAAAVARHAATQRRPYRWAGVAAAAAVLSGIAIVAGLWPAHQAEIADQYRIADELLTTTSWFAPSDVLLPEHQFDIYREIPFLIESTISPEGTLL